MKKELIEMLEDAGVAEPKKVAKALLENTEHGKLFLGEDGAFIPKSRLDAEIKKKEALQESLDDATETIAGLEKTVGENKEAVGKIKEYQTKAEKAEKAMNDLATDEAIKGAIKAFEKESHSVEAVMAMIDRTSIVVKDGKVFGVEAQLKTMSEKQAFLFKESDPDADPEGAPSKGTGKPGKPGAAAGAGKAGVNKDEVESIGASLGKETTVNQAAPTESFFA